MVGTSAKVGLLVAVLASVGSVVRAADLSTCSFFQPGAEQVPAQQCMDCHGLHQTHPVDIDYTSASARYPMFYRSVQEVVRRGVYLPNGQVKCVTCHDPQSQWKYHLVVPPGVTPDLAVEAQTPQRIESSKYQPPTSAPPPGSSVTPTPLCVACHAYDR